MLAFTRHRKSNLRRRSAEARITVSGHTIRFIIEATCWLRVYLDTGLQFQIHNNLSLEGLRQTEDRVCRLELANGLALDLRRNIQVAVVQAVALHSAELWWYRQKGWCENYQRLVNRHRRAITGMLWSA